MSSGFIEKNRNNIHNKHMEDRHKQKLSYPLRMPDDLRSKLEDEANKIGRSLHAEILHRLEKSFAKDVVAPIKHQSLDDALEAVGEEFKRQSNILIESLFKKHGVQAKDPLDIEIDSD